MAEKNYYIILEVKSNATADEIKAAYRILAKKYHPDKNIGNKAAEEYFKEIQQAYAILSNPEKRKKYDLKSSYTTRTQPQQRSSSSGPQYTGNAYQYAQQQAQYQKQQQAYNQKSAGRTGGQYAEKASSATEKKDSSETWQILVSVGIALVLLYFIISYSTEKPAATVTSPFDTKEIAEKIRQINAEKEEPVISNFDSPYTSFFGNEVNESGSKNSISIFNSSYSQAVVCLVEKNAPHKVIRNQYMVNASEFKMNEIPDGDYFLRVYYGSEWNPKKSFPNKTVKGGFKKENGFVELNVGKDALKMKKEKKGSSDSYSTYEIHISPFDKENVKSITAEEFFMK